MALPLLLQRLFEKAGFGNYLNQDIIPNHGIDIHGKNGRDPVKIDGSQITSGVINPEFLPDSVKERIIEVETETSILNLTKDIVQNGDKIIVKTSKFWYIVVDDTKLNSPDGYLALGSTGFLDPETGDYVKGSLVTKKLETPITIQTTGVNSIQENWDGRENINLNVTSIDKELLHGYIHIYHPIIHIISDYKVNSVDIGKFLCINNDEITIELPSILDDDKVINGWNFYIKNLSQTNCNIVPNDPDTKIDNKDVFILPPLVSTQIFFDGNNFISINNIPIVTI